MIHINLYDNHPPQELIDEGQRLTSELLALHEADRKQFIKNNSDYWGRLKDHFLKMSNNKCWYTEAHDVASTYHVDHFRPKNNTLKLTKDFDLETENNSDSYWWLAFDWENYRLSCSVPNTSKNAYFPLRLASAVATCKGEICNEWPGLLDPTNEDDVVWITFCEDGKVYPACGNDETWEAQRVKISVRVYNLNYPSLVDARIEIQNRCKREVEDIIRMQLDYVNNHNPIVKEQISTKIKELRRLINPKSELSSVAKRYLLSRPETFIRNIAG